MYLIPRGLFTYVGALFNILQSCKKWGLVFVAGAWPSIMPREPKVQLKKAKKERKESRGQAVKAEPRSRSRTPASQQMTPSQSSSMVESKAVEQGCLKMHDLMDVVLVDPTLQKESIFALHRRLVLAIKARKVKVPDW